MLIKSRELIHFIVYMPTDYYAAYVPRNKSNEIETSTRELLVKCNETSSIFSSLIIKATLNYRAQTFLK